ncbi:MAG: hypothetical protein KF906_06575 [Actinobacteria bacterium]|nr:hypothetical protein [Actinomycetota bacterium]
MSVDRWSLVRFLHVTAAMVWVGGQLLLSGVVIPALRANTEPELRARLVRATASRFTVLATAVVLPILAATGIALAWHRGVTMQTFSRPGYGHLLGIKISLAVLSVVLAAVHGVLTATRPIAARATAMAGLATSLAVVVFATALVP